MLVDGGDRVGAVQAMNDRFHSVEQIAFGFQGAVDGMRQHFGVGGGVERVARIRQLRLEPFVIFDDAVVDQREPAARHHGVGVFLGRYAVGGPARVRDAEHATWRRCAHLVDQGLDLADTANAVDAVVAQQRNTGGVIAAVFQAPQAFDQNRGDVSFGDGADNSAHGDVLAVGWPRPSGSATDGPGVYCGVGSFLGLRQPGIDF